jgi:uridine kinase
MNSLIIGIAGGSGAGKTTVTRRILESLDSTRVSVIPHDAYYYDCPPDAQGNVSLMNFDHPDSLETSLLVWHLRELRQERQLRFPFMILQRTDARPKRSVLIQQTWSLLKGYLFLSRVISGI